MGKGNPVLQINSAMIDIQIAYKIIQIRIIDREGCTIQSVRLQLQIIKTDIFTCSISLPFDFKTEGRACSNCLIDRVTGGIVGEISRSGGGRGVTGSPINAVF